MSPFFALGTVILTHILATYAFAQEVTNIPEVGHHFRPLVIEKSFNRHNVLSAYTKVDHQCRLLTDRRNRNMPILDFYWLNNRTSYEPLDTGLGARIRDRFQVETTGSRETLYVRLVDLGSMRHDLPDPRIRVTSEESSQTGRCDVEATIQLGPSDPDSSLKVESIYLDLGMMGSVNSITISGHTKFTGRALSKRFAVSGGW